MDRNAVENKAHPVLKLQSKRQLESSRRLRGHSVAEERRTEIPDKAGVVHFVENIKSIHG